MPEGVNKGTGLLELERKGLIDLSRTLVFGDQNNDLSMFEIAAFSVAMGNSRDYIKSKATFTTLSNDEDGISHFFKNFVEPEEEPEEEPQADLGFDPKDFAFQAEKQTLLKEGVVHEEQEDFETRDKEKEGSPLEEEEYLEDERELERARELAREIQEELAAEFGFDQQEDQEEREKKELKIEQKPEAKTERKDGHSCCGLNDKITCPYTKLFTIHQQFTSRFKLNSSSTLDSKLEELIEYAKNDDKDFKDDNSFNALIDELARLLSDERLGVEFALGDLNESLKLSDRFEELYDVISARIPEEVNKR